MIEPDLMAAARVVVSLDRTIRQFPGDPHRKGSSRQKREQGRLAGALLVWEALTGLPPGDAVVHAYRMVGEA